MLDSSKLKEFADNNIKFDENCRKFFKWVENKVGNGEISHYEQFLLFPQCFQKTCTATRKNQGLFWKGLKEITLIGFRQLYLLQVKLSFIIQKLPSCYLPSLNYPLPFVSLVVVFNPLAYINKFHQP